MLNVLWRCAVPNLLRKTRAAVMPAFILAFPLIMGGAGMGADGGRYLLAKSYADEALHSAATAGAKVYTAHWKELAGGRNIDELKADGELAKVRKETETKTKDAVRNIFEANLSKKDKEYVKMRGTDIVASASNTKITASAELKMDTILLKMLGFKQFPATTLRVTSVVTFDRKMTENEVENIEVALVLSDAREIKDIHKALEGFYDILFTPAPDSSPHIDTLEGHKNNRITVSIIPFANLVNTHKKQSIGWVPRSVKLANQQIMDNLTRDTRDVMRLNTMKFKGWGGCLLARPRNVPKQVSPAISTNYEKLDDINDKTPTQKEFVIPPLWMELNKYCNNDTPVVSLTNNPRKNDAKKVTDKIAKSNVYRETSPRASRIFNFEKGQSKIQGLAWGWRTLSDRPLNCGYVTSADGEKKPLVRKFVILMAYNSKEILKKRRSTTPFNWLSANAYGAGFARSYNAKEMAAVAHSDSSSSSDSLGDGSGTLSFPDFGANPHVCFFIGGYNQKYYADSIDPVTSWDRRSSWFKMLYPLGRDKNGEPDAFADSVAAVTGKVLDCDRVRWEQQEYCNPSLTLKGVCTPSGSVILDNIVDEFEKRMVETCQYVASQGKDEIINSDGSKGDAVSLILVTLNHPRQDIGASANDKMTGLKDKSKCDWDHQYTVDVSTANYMNKLKETFSRIASIIRPWSPKDRILIQ